MHRLRPASHLAAAVMCLSLMAAGTAPASAQQKPTASPDTGAAQTEPPALTDADGSEATPTARPALAPDQGPQDVSTDSHPFASPKAAAVDVELGTHEIAVLGVTWRSTADPGRIEYRSRDAQTGVWTEWEELDQAADAPDPGTADAANARGGSEPLVVGAETEVEFRTEHTAAEAEVTEATAAVTSSDISVSRTASAAAAPAAAAPAAASMSYITRKQWGADESLKRCAIDISKSPVRALTVHHTAGATNYSKAQVPGILRGILRYHTQKLGWCDIGYNMLVDRFGGVYQGRSGSHDQAVIGAHASGFNTGTFGVSVMGTYSSPAPKAAIAALGRVAQWQAAKWNYDPKGTVTLTSEGGTSKFRKGQKVTLPRIFAHRDTGYTDCPGNGLYSQMNAIRAEAGKKPQPTYTTRGAIGTYYNSHRSLTGEPQMNEAAIPGGAYQRFARGSVHWSRATGAHFTQQGSSIQRTWAALRYERGPLRFPTSDPFRLRFRAQTDFQRFQGGRIVAHPQAGTHTLVGAIGQKWEQLGWERSYLRLPTGSEHTLSSPRGAYQSFEGGSIHWSKATGAHATTGAIRSAWAKQKWERGALGFPTSEEHSWKGKVRQNFQGGYITWTRSEGTRVHRS